MSSCRTCGAPLAVDQRWCVECGTRRGPVSPWMQALIASAADASAAEVPETDAPARGRLTFPSPRAAAVAVSGVLAFGVVIGSVVSPAAVGQAESPLVIAVSPPAAAPKPAPAPVEDEAPVEDAVAEAPVEEAPQQQIIYVTEPQDTTPAAPTPPPALPIPPPPPIPTVSHVFVVMLTGHGYNAAFGPDSQAPYLSKTLTTHGELIPNYYAVTHGELANATALVSGQGPTKATIANCPQYGDVTPGTIGDQGQASGDGCVYPTDVKTLADQLFSGGNTWKAYVEGSGAAGCDHATTSYATTRNPFLWFHSLTDNAALCNPNVADLTQLQTDLAQVGDTPGLSYIVPSRCHDGSDTPCAPDQPAGLPAADAWLQTVIPMIEESAGFKQGGLIAITFDNAPADGPEADSSACCGQPDQYPNLDPVAPAPPADPNAPPPDPTAPPVKPTGGGGKVGLLLISPYVKPNTINETGYYNHFSLFASIEDMFSLGGIAYANLPDLTRFDKTVYTAYNTDGTNGTSTGDQPASGSRAR